MASTPFDFTTFTDWVAAAVLELPADREPDVYDLADRLCIAWTLDAPVPGAWIETLQERRRPDGLFVERTPTHHPWHSTAFAIAALELADAAPDSVPALDAYRTPEAVRAFLAGLDWRHGVYGDSHRGAGLLSIGDLVPGFAPSGWSDAAFDLLDELVDPANGMHGRAKPPGGDLDQIGGSFHYHFVYEFHDRPLPHPGARIDAVLGLQRDDGLWHPLNPMWLTLDAVYLAARTSARTGDRRADVEGAITRTLHRYRADHCTPAARDRYTAGPLGAHGCTAVISLLAEAQRFLGRDRVVTGTPLRSVLDRRPFI